MKTIKLSLLAAFAAMLMMTSCLSSGNNEVQMYGIGRLKNTSLMTTVFHYSDSDYPVLLANAQTELFGEKYLRANFTINLDDEVNSPANVEAKGYYTGAFLNGTTKISAKSFTVEDVNLEDKLENEYPFYAYGFFTVIDKAFFINVAVKAPEDSRLTYKLEYDSTQEVKKESVSGVSGEIPVYDFYLRVVVDETSNKSTQIEDLFVFELGSEPVMSSIFSKEIVDNYYFGMRINTVKEFDDDEETVKSWQAIGVVPVYTGKKAS